MVMMTLYARQQKKLLDSMGEGKHGMTWENSIETCILPYVNYITNPCSMQETGHSRPVYWDDPEGWDAEGGGRGIQDGVTWTPVADSCWYMVKATTIL